MWDNIENSLGFYHGWCRGEGRLRTFRLALCACETHCCTYTIVYKDYRSFGDTLISFHIYCNLFVLFLPNIFISWGASFFVCQGRLLPRRPLVWCAARAHWCEASKQHPWFFKVLVSISTDRSGKKIDAPSRGRNCWVVHVLAGLWCPSVGWELGSTPFICASTGESQLDQRSRQRFLLLFFYETTLLKINSRFALPQLLFCDLFQWTAEGSKVKSTCQLDLSDFDFGVSSALSINSESKLDRDEEESLFKLESLCQSFWWSFWSVGIGRARKFKCQIWTMRCFACCLSLDINKEKYVEPNYLLYNSCSWSDQRRLHLGK